MELLPYVPPILAFGVASISLFFQTSKNQDGNDRKVLTKAGWLFIGFLLATLLTGIGTVYKSYASAKNAEKAKAEAIEDQKQLNAKVVDLQEKLEKAKKDAEKRQIELIEKVEDTQHVEARYDIRWVLSMDGPAKKRLIQALNSNKTLFEAIHIGQEAHKKPDVRKRLNAYGSKLAEAYAKRFAETKLSAGDEVRNAVLNSRLTDVGK